MTGGVDAGRGVPETVKVCHITHVNNLRQVFTDGFLFSDREILSRGGPEAAIGMSSIKRRRLDDIAVPVGTDLKVGDCVPFYFCPRSVMLYVLHKGNSPELEYTEGQRPIVHLVGEMTAIVDWAESEGLGWCFSLSNAGAYYTEFRSSLNDLGDLDWKAIFATDFRPQVIKEGKQAEFLVEHRVPVDLFDTIGVIDAGMAKRVEEALAGIEVRPRVEVKPRYYF